MIDYMTKMAILVVCQEHERRWGTLIPNQEDRSPVMTSSLYPNDEDLHLAPSQEDGSPVKTALPERLVRWSRQRLYLLRTKFTSFDKRLKHVPDMPLEAAVKGQEGR